MASTIDTNRLTTFVWKDLGIGRIQRELGALERGSVFVGWPGNSPQHREVKHRIDSKGKTRTSKGKRLSSMTMAAIALVHEFGSPKRNIPARPIMRQTNQRHSKDLVGFNRRILLAICEGRVLPTRALAQLGVFWEGKIKGMFRSGSFAPLKRSTIIAKGSSRPLIDSGQLRGSVTSVVKS